ncbi:diguanylate cyclase (GGDEF)-like protein [Mesorhizobium soli]|uniref:GGDEF domain-containing protein n=1 Tax=Pseudaminobacter soli (ex Li et al. 2025) TaxID=1295366 RepID=UPI00247392BD|nr:GGDEF domain-containing protein [Mesorhizobium soli]MDH6232340.1 diguanylate cyclase (GGDEF)-like protein [Mesorhizobium soli]
MGNFRLQHLYWLAGWVAVAGCLVLGGMLFFVSLKDYRRYSQGLEEFDRFRLALLAANAISAERGPANSLMGANLQMTPEFNRQLAKRRVQTDQAIAALEAAYAKDSSRFEKDQEAVVHLREELAEGRKAVDAIAGTPIADRKGNQLAVAINSMFRAADAATDVADRLGQTIVSVYPQVSTEIVMANNCGRLREQAGRFGSYVVMMLTAADGDDTELSLMLANTAGRIEILRELIAGYGAAYLADATVSEILHDVDQAYFDTALPYAWSVALKAIKEPATMTTGEFTTNYVPGMLPVEHLRDLIIERLAARITVSRDNDALLLGSSAALTLLVTTLLVVISAAMRRFLFQPLLSAKDQIIQIAHGDLAEPPLPRSFSREIRDMFEGLQVLRESQRKRTALESERDRLTARLKMLSETDSLTGLLNRRAIDGIGTQAVADAARTREPVAFLLMDIDHFKAVNDTHGHGVGDLVLQRVGETLRKEVRSIDVVARFGGEEFVVMVRSATADGGRQLAEKLRLALAAMVVSPNHPELRITASFGVALWGPGIGSWTALIEQADRQLYRAKNLGRNRVCMAEDETGDGNPEPAAPRRKVI